MSDPMTTTREWRISSRDFAKWAAIIAVIGTVATATLTFADLRSDVRSKVDRAAVDSLRYELRAAMISVRYELRAIRCAQVPPAQRPTSIACESSR